MSLVCASCGGSNVARSQWVDANGGGIIEETGQGAKCWDCNDLVELITAYEFARHEQREVVEDLAVVVRLDNRGGAL
jgi:hypothetical protein